jgi:hypothetical protein
VPITYTNTKAQTYCLHHGRAKTGKPKYYFSLKREGSLAESIPEGFEIYETPNAQVFLRRIPPQLITAAERQMVEEGMRKYASVQDYKIDVKGKAIVINPADQDRETLAGIVRDYACSPDEQTRMLKVLQQTLHYSSMLQFILVDEQRRVFAAQRSCFRGAIEDWIHIGMPDTLTKLVRRYVKHLGRESYFDLW